MSSSSILFIDSCVTGHQTLIDSLTEPLEVFILDGESDGLLQIAAHLQGRSGIDAIHVVSHGRQGALYLGNTLLDNASIASYAGQLAEIGKALTDDGDILLYGCDVAQGDAGLQFISSLAECTGADVAASSDATGSPMLGGNWVLEQVVSSVGAFALQAVTLDGLLGTNTAPTFDVGYGKVTTDFQSSTDTCFGLTIQVDGKILAAGQTQSGRVSDFAVVRYNTDGTLDISLDDDGKVTTDFSSGWDIGHSVIVQADGKILVAGYSGQVSSEYLALVRYNTDGSVDTSFDGDGKVTTSFGSTANDGNSVTLQEDGKILIGGMGSVSMEDFALARYNPDGSLDTSFDTDGKVTTDLGYRERISEVLVEPDGKILVCGSSVDDRGTNSAVCLLRYNTDGSLDTSFGDGGRVSSTVPISQDGSGFVIQPDGKILVAGTVFVANGATRDFLLLRYNANGSLDTSFDVDGIVSTNVAYSNYGSGLASDSGKSIVIQPDGKILVAGKTSNGDGQDFAVVRYNSDGSLDHSFDFDGKKTIDFGLNYDSASGFLVQADGKILVGGSSIHPASADSVFAMVRLNSDGSEDTSFNRSTTSTLTNSGGAAAPNAPIVIARQVSVYDAELFAKGNYDGASLTLQRQGTANAGDLFGTSGQLSFTSGLLFYAGTAIATETQSNGKLTLTFNSNASQFAVDSALRSLTYAYTGSEASSNVNLAWSFADGNTGAQGAGGGQVATGNSVVMITDVTPPTVSSFNPTPGAIDVAVGSNVVLTFDEPIQRGTGNIVLKNSIGTIIATYSAASSANLSIAGDTLTMNPTLDLAFNTRYLLEFASGSVKDMSGNTYGGTNGYGFVTGGQDTTAPTVTTFSPSDEAAAVAIGANIVVAFGEAITKGVGNIVLKTGEGVVVATYNATTSTNLSISGSTLTINPTADLDYSKGYKVEFSAGSIKDIAGNGYAGFNDYNFTTASRPNYNPTGSVTISGASAQGQTLTAANTLADLDGLGAITYRWSVGGVTTAGATNSTYVLTQSDVGKAITVAATYTDLFNYEESVVSSATSAVANVNDPPTGSVTIFGTATQGQTLTAANTLADLDGLGTIAYRWSAGASAISGATESTFTLTEAQVGKTITVTAIYTDSQGSAETVRSSGSVAVANLNDPGLVIVTGVLAVGQTLAGSVSDSDGVDTTHFQWLAGGQPISGANAQTFVMTQTQIGQEITLTADYTDGHGQHESVTGGLGFNADVLAYSWKAHTLLHGVRLDLGNASQTSDTVGKTLFTRVADANITISATRSVPAIEAASTSAAVNLQDAIAILKMIVGLSVNGSNQALSPYQALAADYDGNGTVQLSDAIGVLKHVVGLSAPDPTWYFVNEIDTSVPGKTDLNPGVPQSTLTADLSGQGPVHVGLVGYLSGDVDGSFAGASGAYDLDVTQPDYIASLVGLHAELSLAQFGM